MRYPDGKTFSSKQCCEQCADSSYHSKTRSIDSRTPITTTANVVSQTFIAPTRVTRPKLSQAYSLSLTQMPTYQKSTQSSLLITQNNAPKFPNHAEPIGYFLDPKSPPGFESQALLGRAVGQIDRTDAFFSITPSFKSTGFLTGGPYVFSASHADPFKPAEKKPTISMGMYMDSWTPTPQISGPYDLNNPEWAEWQPYIPGIPSRKSAENRLSSQIKWEGRKKAQQRMMDLGLQESLPTSSYNPYYTGYSVQIGRANKFDSENQEIILIDSSYTPFTENLDYPYKNQLSLLNKYFNLSEQYIQENIKFKKFSENLWDFHLKKTGFQHDISYNLLVPQKIYNIFDKNVPTHQIYDQENIFVFASHLYGHIPIQESQSLKTSPMPREKAYLIGVNNFYAGDIHLYTNKENTQVYMSEGKITKIVGHPYRMDIINIRNNSLKEKSRINETITQIPSNIDLYKTPLLEYTRFASAGGTSGAPIIFEQKTSIRESYAAEAMVVGSGTATPIPSESKQRYSPESYDIKLNDNFIQNRKNISLAKDIATGNFFVGGQGGRAVNSVCPPGYAIAGVLGSQVILDNGSELLGNFGCFCLPFPTQESFFQKKDNQLVSAYTFGFSKGRVLSSGSIDVSVQNNVQGLDLGISNNLGLYEYLAHFLSTKKEHPYAVFTYDVRVGGGWDVELSDVKKTFEKGYEQDFVMCPPGYFLTELGVFVNNFGKHRLIEAIPLIGCEHWMTGKKYYRGPRVGSLGSKKPKGTFHLLRSPKNHAMIGFNNRSGWFTDSIQLQTQPYR